MKNLRVFLFYFLFIFCFIFPFTKGFSQKRTIYLDLNTNIGYFLMNESPFHIDKVIDKRGFEKIGETYWISQERKDIFFKTDAETEIMAYFKKILPPKIPNNIPITFVLLELNISHPFYVLKNSQEYMPKIFIKGFFLNKNGEKLSTITTSFQVQDQNQSFRNTDYHTYKGLNSTKIANEIHYIYGIQEALKENVLKFEKIWKKKKGVFEKLKSTK